MRTQKLKGSGQAIKKCHSFTETHCKREASDLIRIMWVNLEFNGEQKGFVKTKSLENFEASNIWKSVGNDYIFRIQGQVND